MSKHLLDKFNEVEQIHWWWEGRRQMLRQLLPKKKNQKILDIGFGTGETMSFLNSFLTKPMVYGIDTSTTAVKYAQSRGHKKVKKAKATKLPFKKNTFDTVIILDVIEHIQDDLTVFKEAKRVLKKGGTIIITCPALPFIWSEHDANQGHKRRYTRTRLRYLAKQSNMKIDFISYFNFFLSPIIIPIRLLSRLKTAKNLSNYDSKLNFEIAKNKLINSILKNIFVTEVKLTQSFNYPIGISIAGRFTKTNEK